MVKKKVTVSYVNPKLETMDRNELDAFQLRKLKRQIEYVYQNNLFYRRKFEKAEINPDDINSLADFRRKVPTLDKAEVVKDQMENPPFGSILGVPRDRLSLVMQTSGTSGRGQERYGITSADLNTIGECNAFGGFYWAGLRRGDMGATFLNVSLTGAPWVPIEGFRKIGATCLPLGAYSTETRLRIMKEMGVNFICTTPTYLNQLEQICRKIGFEPQSAFPDLKAIWLGLDSYLIKWAERMENRWNAVLHDHYGCAQAGATIASTCEFGAIPEGRRGCMHIYEWLFLVEVINHETMEPVSSGEEGELVLTTLTKEASPVMRYRTGDRVRYLDHNFCDCGRAFRGIEAGTVGRFDDMIKMKGVNIWPEHIDEILFARDEIVEYSAKLFVDCTKGESILIQVEFKPEVNSIIREKILSDVAETIKVKTQVSMKLVEAEQPLQRWESKPSRWVDDRKSSLSRII